MKKPVGEPSPFMLVCVEHEASFDSGYFNIPELHTCDKFEKGIREVFFSFQGDFSKMYRIYRKIVTSFQGDLLIL